MHMFGFSNFLLKFIYMHISAMGGIVIWLTMRKLPLHPEFPTLYEPSQVDVLHFVPRSLDSPLAHTRHQKKKKRVLKLIDYK